MLLDHPRHRAIGEATPAPQLSAAITVRLAPPVPASSHRWERARFPEQPVWWMRPRGDFPATGSSRTGARVATAGLIVSALALLGSVAAAVVTFTSGMGKQRGSMMPGGLILCGLIIVIAVLAAIALPWFVRRLYSSSQARA